MKWTVYPESAQPFDADLPVTLTAGDYITLPDGTIQTAYNPRTSVTGAGVIRGVVTTLKGIINSPTVHP